VSKKWRGHDFYKLLMIEVTRYSVGKSALMTLGVIHPDFPLRGFLHEIGFEAIGNPTATLNPPFGYQLGQLIGQRPSICLNNALLVRQKCVERLLAKDFDISG
jgi:hypothetical protein